MPTSVALATVRVSSPRVAHASYCLNGWQPLPPLPKPQRAAHETLPPYDPTPVPFYNRLITQYPLTDNEFESVRRLLSASSLPIDKCFYQIPPYDGGSHVYPHTQTMTLNLIDQFGQQVQFCYPEYYAQYNESAQSGVSPVVLIRALH